jgi:hypothetical protein
MRKWYGAMVLIALVAAGSSARSAMNAADASLASDAEVTAADATSDAVEGSSDDGANADACARTCPASEPTEGGPCDSSALCEYGDDPRSECNRVYACSSGHFEGFSLPSDDAGCPTALAALCPPTKASLSTGAACTPTGLRCTYVEGECTCGRSAYDGGSSWFCLPYNSLTGSDAACPVPRPHLGTPCSGTESYCQYESTCIFQACTCDHWALGFVPCGEHPPPPPVDSGPEGGGDSSVDSAFGDDSSIDGSLGRGDASTRSGNSGGCGCRVADRRSGAEASGGVILAIALRKRRRRSDVSAPSKT